MNKENRDKLERILSQDLNNYENYGFNDEEKSRAWGIISKEIAVLLAEEKTERDLARIAEDDTIEAMKLQFDQDMRMKEYELKVEQLKFDQTKLETEWGQKVIDNTREGKRLKVQLWTSVATVAAPILLGMMKLITYTSLTLNAQRHDYNDYQLESSSSKENRNNIIK